MANVVSFPKNPSMAELTKRLQDARTAYQYWGMRNTFGLSSEDRAQLDQEYHMAEAIYLKALDALQVEAKRTASSRSDEP